MDSPSGSLRTTTTSSSNSFSARRSTEITRNNSSSGLTKTLSDGSSQSLASILNNPHVGKTGIYGSDASSWVGWWSSSAAAAAANPPEFAPLPTRPPPHSPASAPEVSRSDFQRYVNSIAETYDRFEDIRNHDSKESLADLEGIGSQGEALVSCLREVPALYFKEDFALEDGATFSAACPFSAISENVVLQEKLTQYLDMVELHLVKEISLRSSSFFEAQGQLQDLNVKIVQGCSQIRELKETIRLLETDLVESAKHIQESNGTRTNLLGLQQKLRLILYVNQALSALRLLVASGDCAGALDVIDDLRNLLDGDELAGLHCFRHLRDHVTGFIDSVNSILSAEFLRAALHDTEDVDMIILSKAKARASGAMDGRDEVVLDKDDASIFRDRLLPIVIGLLRTAKLPSVLRIYRETVTADMKTAIKTVVAELLPLLVSRPLDSDFTAGDRTTDIDGGGLSLASKLRSLSSESFVQLLGAIFKIVQAHLVQAAEVKKAIEWIMLNHDGHYAVGSSAAGIFGVAAADATSENDGEVGSLILYSPKRNSTKVSSFQEKANFVTSSSNLSKNFRADVLRENTEAVFAACDVAHGRWAKLLGVRAILHPKLRLHEFLSIYGVTQEFITITEKIGGRLGYSIRGTLQSQAKAFVDFQHDSRMAKLKAVLDQESWVEVDVPDEFQAIIGSLFFCEALTSAGLDDAQDNVETIDRDMVLSNGMIPSFDGRLQNPQGLIERSNSLEVAKKNSSHMKSSSLDGVTDKNKIEVMTSAVQSNISNIKGREKLSSQTLSYKGVSYHMVNCGLILLKMLSEYIDMNNFLPSLSSEVVHRVVEILKFFNTRTCQLVLGAGAMQVAGLKSITSKHLALASQVISFVFIIIPEIRRILFLKVPETRKALLMLEIDRVAQDYKIHRDEIHTKLVQIMRERLLFHLRGLPQIVENWNRHEDTDSQPSHFARSLTKEVGYLQRVLSRILHELDVQAIFRQVVIIFHSQISEAFSHLEITTPHAKNRLYLDIQHILACIRSLPSDNLSDSTIPNIGQLDEFLVQRFDREAVLQNNDW